MTLTNFGDNFEIEENGNGDYVVRYTPTDTVIERIDSGNEEKIFEVAAQITELTGRTSGATVYDDATQTVGDGTTSAEHESVNAGRVNTTHYIRPSQDAQSVLDQLEPGDEAIFLPGIHEADNLDIPVRNVTIRGVGRESHLQKPAQTLDGSYTWVLRANVDNIMIRDLQVDFNLRNHTDNGSGSINGYEAIDIDGDYPRVENCYVRDTRSEGIDFDGGETGWFIQNHIIDCGGSGIHNSTDSVGSVNIGNRVENCGWDSNRSGIDQYQEASKGIIVGNEIIGCDNGISVGSDDVVIADNHIRNTSVAGDGISLDGSGGVVSGNFVDGGDMGINCTGSNYRIVGNTVEGIDTNGIRVNPSSIQDVFVTVTGNHVNGGNRGIRLVNPRMVSVTGNTVTGTTDAALGGFDSDYVLYDGNVVDGTFGAAGPNSVEGDNIER